MQLSPFINFSVCIALFFTCFDIASKTECSIGHENSFICERNAFEIGSKEWIKQKLEAYPELTWLAEKDVLMTHDYTAKDENSYSQDLFRKQYVEFDRTLLALEFFHRTLRGSKVDYEWLVKNQNPSQKLTLNSFHELHNFLVNEINNIDTHLFELAIVLGDMGKSQKARKLAPEISKKNSDQDAFYGQVIRLKPEIFPSFQGLSEKQKLVLQRGAHLIHFGHVTHLEGNSSMFLPLKDSKILNSQAGEVAFKIEFLTHMCDVAGAAGHVNRQGSIVLTEPTYLRLKNVYDAALMLREKSPDDALNAYLKWSAHWLGQKLITKEDEVVIRIASMMRLSDKDDTLLVKKSLEECPQEYRDLILEMFAFDALESPIKTPTYIPAVLSNLSKNKSLDEDSKKRIRMGVQLGALAIARALKFAKKNSLFQSGNIILNFNPMASQAKQADALTLFTQENFEMSDLGDIKFK